MRKIFFNVVLMLLFISVSSVHADTTQCQLKLNISPKYSLTPYVYDLIGSDESKCWEFISADGRNIGDDIIGCSLNGSVLKFEGFPSSSVMLRRSFDVDLRKLPFFELMISEFPKRNLEVRIGFRLPEGTVNELYIQNISNSRINLLQQIERTFPYLRNSEVPVRALFLDIILSDKENADKVEFSTEEDSIKMEKIAFSTENSVLVRAERTEIKFKHLSLLSEEISESAGSVDLFDIEPAIKVQGERNILIEVCLNKNYFAKNDVLRLEYGCDNSENVICDPGILDTSGTDNRFIRLPEYLFKRGKGVLELDCAAFYGKYNKDKFVLQVSNFPKDAKDKIRFYLRSADLCRKFIWPLDGENAENVFLRLLRSNNPDLLSINGKIFNFKFFDMEDIPEILKAGRLEREINLIPGKSEYIIFDNITFNIDDISLNLPAEGCETVINEEPKIVFERVNPTKYYIHISEIKEPFWLIFGETFHPLWRLYFAGDVFPEVKNKKIPKIGYNGFNVSEIPSEDRFILSDIRFLFKKYLSSSHKPINGYANGWMIDPDDLNGQSDCTLILFFWPQSLFCLGLIVVFMFLITSVYVFVFKRKRYFK